MVINCSSPCPGRHRRCSHRRRSCLRRQHRLRRRIQVGFQVQVGCPVTSRVNTSHQNSWISCFTLTRTHTHLSPKIVCSMLLLWIVCGPRVCVLYYCTIHRWHDHVMRNPSHHTRMIGIRITLYNPTASTRDGGRIGRTSNSSATHVMCVISRIGITITQYSTRAHTYNK